MKYIILLLLVLAITAEAKKKNHLKKQVQTYGPWVNQYVSTGEIPNFPMDANQCKLYYQSKLTQQNNLCTQVFGPMDTACSQNPETTWKSLYIKYAEKVCPKQNGPQVRSYTCANYAEDSFFFNGNYVKNILLERRSLHDWLLKYAPKYQELRIVCK